jgi:hypothetical protein
MEMKDRWLILLIAFGLLGVGIDRMLFDRITSDDLLAGIHTTITIVVGWLLSTLGISLFVAAWRGRFPGTEMSTNSIKGKLLTHAFGAGPPAFLIGFFLVHTMTYWDLLDFTCLVLFGATLILWLIATRRAVGRLAPSETAKIHATQFQWSCIFFGMLSLMFGMAVSRYVWFGTDFIGGFGVVFSSAMMAVAIYPVCRDAKRLADAAGQVRFT